MTKESITIVEEGGDVQLLSAGDPDPVVVLNKDGNSPFVLTCEHAGCQVPEKLASLGLSDRDLRRHIGWDIGALGTARAIARAMDAVLVSQTYSRLVIDCNRPPLSAEAMLRSSDGTEIPGNAGIDEAERASRRQEIHQPFHDQVDAILEARLSGRKPTALIALHSFTPALTSDGKERPWDLGLLYNRDRRLADLMDRALADLNCGLNVAHNQPYAVNDHSDYTIPIHGERRGIPNLLLEIRNDHIHNQAGVSEWSDLLTKVLTIIEQRGKPRLWG
ncbi:MAG: N-formylglutamate amidohydrolase [Pseudomonadota bacterium]